MADVRINALATTASSSASDDYLAIDGSANGTRKMSAYSPSFGGNATVGGTLASTGNITAPDLILGTSGPSTKSSVAARAPRQGLAFSGTGVATATMSTAKTLAFSFNASADSDILGLGWDVGSIRTSVSSGNLRVETNNPYTLYTTPVTLGKTYHVVYVGVSGSPLLVYVNGVLAITGSNNLAADITANTSALRLGANHTDSASFVGTITSPLAYNRALSAAEVLALYESGTPAGADYATPAATNTSLNTVAFANTGYGFNAYTTFSGASATGFSAAAATTATYAAGTGSTFNTTNGKNLRVTFTLTLNSGQAPTITIAKAFNPDASANYTATAGSNTFVIPMTRTDTGYTVRFLNTAATDYVISNFSVVPAGLLLAPDIAQAGNGYVWNDQSGNLAQIVLPSSGVAWNLPSVVGNRIRGTTSTNGNQQLLGASTLLPAECQITYVRARARSGTPTITIGTASGGAQIVASVALSTTWLNCTIALAGGIVSSADDIWVNSNSTDVVETDIAFQPLDF